MVIHMNGGSVMKKICHDHNGILNAVRSDLPAEELLCDLADLFKLF